VVARYKKSVPVEPHERERTAKELAAVQSFERKANILGLKVLKSENGDMITPDHADVAVGWGLLADAVAANDVSFLIGLLNQLGKTSSKGGAIDEIRVNFMLSVVTGGEPRDQIEAMLCAQMAAVHVGLMTLAPQLYNAETVVHRDSAERAFNKLARTFTTQVEALKRYRTGGEQKMTVQHVTVSEGGQAIVGNVSQTSRETNAKPEQLALMKPQMEPMPILNERPKTSLPRRGPNK
jgi:hypothetical protein